MPDFIRVTAIQRLCVNDGPGVRTVVFLKGCYLECPWCCNPETIHYEKDDFFEKGICRFPNESIICRNCELPGGNINKTNCPIGAFEKTYSDFSEKELFELLLRDESIYQNGGGVTFSGGEPLMQSKCLRGLLLKLRDRGIHVAYETTLYAPLNCYELIKNYVDHWIVDLKFQYGYVLNRDYNIDKEALEKNLYDLQSRNCDVTYRMVIMSEALSKLDSIIFSLKKHRIVKIELLACHSLAENKYKELRKPFHRFGTPSKVDLDRACGIISSCGIDAHYVSL